MANPRSGQITVTTAGTAVQGTNIGFTGADFLFKAHPNNTAAVWVGNDGAGDVDNNNGFPLQPGEAIVAANLDNLNELWFDANVSGEKICWFLV